MVQSREVVKIMSGCEKYDIILMYNNLILHLSLCMRKTTICIGENKAADQLRGNREADQRLCFRYTDSTFPPLLIPKLSRFWVSSVTVQAGLCWTWSETQIVGFLMHRLIYFVYMIYQYFRQEYIQAVR